MSNGKLTKSELEVGAKIDRCLQDALIKVGSGIGLGIVFSVVLFKSEIAAVDL
jgi:inner membrane organizing system protein 1